MERTLKLIDDIKPDVINISKFFPRPNTPAAKMSQVEAKEIVTRSRSMAEYAKRISLERNEYWLGWEGEILIDEKGADDSWIGRNYAYKPIVVKSRENILGEFINVRIIGAHVNHLEARVA